MKSIVITLSMVLFSMSANAQYFFTKSQMTERQAAMKLNAAATGRTVDAPTTVWLVSHNWQEDGFSAREYTMIGCWGVPYGARAAQFGAEFQINERGCGNNVEFCPTAGTWNGYHNVNAITCAKAVEVKYDEPDYNKVESVNVVAEGCEFWSASDAQTFQASVIEAATKNFDLPADKVTVDMTGVTIQN